MYLQCKYYKSGVRKRNGLGRYGVKYKIVLNYSALKNLNIKLIELFKDFENKK